MFSRCVVPRSVRVCPFASIRNVPKRRRACPVGGNEPTNFALARFRLGRRLRRSNASVPREAEFARLVAFGSENRDNALYVSVSETPSAIARSQASVRKSGNRPALSVRREDPPFRRAPGWRPRGIRACQPSRFGERRNCRFARLWFGNERIPRLRASVRERATRVFTRTALSVRDECDPSLLERPVRRRIRCLPRASGRRTAMLPEDGQGCY